MKDNPFRLTPPQINIDAILEAVGSEHVTASLNRQEIADDIARVAARYSYRRELEAEPRSLSKKREAALLKIRASAEKVLSALSGPDGEWLQSRFAQRFPLYEGEPKGGGWQEGAPSFSGFQSGLKLLIQIAEKDIEDRAAAPNTIMRFDHQPIVLLIGEMATVFEKWFETSAGYTKKVERSKGDHRVSDGDAEGPFINFVVRALYELRIRAPDGIQYSPNTIGAYLTEYQSGKSRRSAE